MTIREIRQFVLSCNHNGDLSAGMCKARLTLTAHSEEEATRLACEMGWESVLRQDLCAAHRRQPVRACSHDGTVMRVEGGLLTCRQGHTYLRGQLVLPC
jgi:hypothetical protein